MEATNAGVGSAVSKCMVYPLDLIKTKMATSGCSFEVAVKDLKEEEGGSIAGLYKGLSMKLVKSVTGKFFYFYLYSTLSGIRLAQLRRSAGSKDAQVGLDTVSNLVIGYFSEFLELPLIMPLEAVVSRVQSSTNGESALGIARRVYKEEGIGAFYVSLDSYLMGAFMPAIQMSIYDQLRPILLRLRGAVDRDLNGLEAFLLGIVASSIAVTATYPLDLVRTQKQAGNRTETCEDSGENGKDLSFFQTLSKIVEKEGVKGAFRGLSPQLSQAVLSTSIMFMVKEQVKSYTTRFLLAILALVGFRKSQIKQA